MIVSMKEVLDKAKLGGYAVPAPNVWDFYSIKAAIEAAEEENSPIILDFYDQMNTFEDFTHIATYLANKTAVPVAINHDHGSIYENSIKAIRTGFSSIMVDRSELPYEENMKEVAELAQVAHAVGVSVEAELGHVGTGTQYDLDRDAGLTNPAHVATFIEKTEIDCLAVAIGTAHGTYKGEPHLDYELLEQIASISSVPLVLHGGSGTGDEALQKVVQLGIQKVNLYTDLSKEGLASLEKYMTEQSNKDLGQAMDAAFQGFKEKVKHYIRLFGASQKHETTQNTVEA